MSRADLPDLAPRSLTPGSLEVRPALAPFAAATAPERREALALRPFLEVCLGASGPTLVEAGRGAELVGLVEVKDGQVWRCVHQDHEGDRALRELLEEPFDEIVVRRGAGGHGVRNVFAAGLPEDAPSQQAVREEPASEPRRAREEAGGSVADFAGLWDAGVSALLERDLAGAAAAFQSAALLCPDDPKVLANLVRLRDLGYGRPGGRALESRPEGR